MARAEIGIKPLRTNDQQMNVSIEEAIRFLKESI
jgi:hypothetical protein